MAVSLAMMVAPTGARQPPLTARFRSAVAQESWSTARLHIDHDWSRQHRRAGRVDRLQLAGVPVARLTSKADRGGVGNIVAANDDLDYAVIKFDPAKVVPTASFAGFAINGIGPDPSGFGQPVCTQGGATGFGCGAFRFGGPRPAYRHGGHADVATRR